VNEFEDNWIATGLPMSDENKDMPDEVPSPPLTSVTPDELAQVDIEAPISVNNSFDTGNLGDLFRRASEESAKAGNQVEALVYALLQGMCQMHFRPIDRAEPFGPLMVLADGRRTIIPSDIAMPLNDALAARVPTIRDPVLRARIADVAWTNNRRLGACATTAVSAYCEAVELLRAGKLELRYEQADVTDHDVIDRLRRACQIALVTSGKEPLPDRLKKSIADARTDALGRKYLYGFLQSAGLDLDFGISAPADIAREAEALFGNLPSIGDGHMALSLLEISSRAFHDARDSDNESRLIVMAAECCVARADALTHAPILESHWLTRAIAIYGRVRAKRDRRNELRKRLIDVQARGLDELSPIGHSTDIGDIVQSVREKISGRSLADAIRMLVLASHSPSPVKLRDEALATVKKSPLSSLFSTSVLDRGGKVTFRSPGLSGSDSTEQEKGLRFEIMQHESLRRALVLRSTLYPARGTINAEHGITANKLLPLVEASPFVPPGYEFLFAHGFARWFGGDQIAAVSILVPQLENSLRYILINAGEDVTTMKNDGTQEDRSITSLFDSMRDQIVRIVGQAIAYEIENLFLFRGGPVVRHAVAHGQLPAGGFFSNDAEYACWLIFQLCCLPLIPHWSDVESALGSGG
jgi:hypothetical protein